MASRGTWKLVIGGSTFVDYTDVAEPLDAGGMPGIQERRLFRGTADQWVARGNFSAKAAFSFVITQADNKASADFFMKAAQLWNGVATVVVYHTDYTGTETSYTLTGAVVEVKPGKPVGVTNTGTVSFTGGLVS